MGSNKNETNMILKQKKKGIKSHIKGKVNTKMS